MKLAGRESRHRSPVDHPDLSRVSFKFFCFTFLIGDNLGKQFKLQQQKMSYRGLPASSSPMVWLDKHALGRKARQCYFVFPLYGSNSTLKYRASRGAKASENVPQGTLVAHWASVVLLHYTEYPSGTSTTLLR